MKRYAVVILVLLTGCSAVHERSSVTGQSVEYYTDWVTLENKIQIQLSTTGDDSLLLTVAVRDKTKHDLNPNVGLLMDGQTITLDAADRQTTIDVDWYPHQDPLYSENPAFSPHDPTTVSSRQYRLEFSSLKTLLASSQATIKVSVEDGILEESLWNDGDPSSEKRMVTELRDRLLAKNPDRFKE